MCSQLPTKKIAARKTVSHGMSRSVSPDDAPRHSGSASPVRSRSRSRSASPMDRSRSQSPSDRDRLRRRSRSPLREPISLYISGLAAKVIDEDLYDHFRKEGKIKEARVVLDPRTRDSRGFGFVDYEDPRDAETAIRHLDKTTLKGRIIIVEKAKRARPRTPTPGEYRGVRELARDPAPYRGSRYGERDGRDRYNRYDRYRRSPSPYRRRRSPPVYRRRSPSPYRGRSYSPY